MGITQANEFNEIMKSWKRTEPPGRPKQYSKYRELLDGAEEDIDPAIYCNRRSYIYKKTAEDLAKIFVGIRSDINDIEWEIGMWQTQKFSLYKVNYNFQRPNDLCTIESQQPVDELIRSCFSLIKQTTAKILCWVKTKR